MAVRVLPQSGNRASAFETECAGVYSVVGRTQFDHSEAAVYVDPELHDEQQLAHNNAQLAFAGGIISGLLLQNVVTSRHYQSFTLPLELSAIQNIAFNGSHYNVARVSSLNLARAVATDETTSKTLSHIATIKKREAVGRELVVAHNLNGVIGGDSLGNVQKILNELALAPKESYRIAIFSGRVALNQREVRQIAQARAELADKANAPKVAAEAIIGEIIAQAQA